ncbi:MAG: hypothetical protein L6R40_006127 [Gallowayella cf. fulva]|nr:MAG: hypothetical protein L6R40_006127 [Xanthomendoza cf. fulva]
MLPLCLALPFLLLHLTPTRAVDIKFYWLHRHASIHSLRDPVTATCLSQPPGVCCIPHRDIILPDIHESLFDYMSSTTTFSSLRLSQLGFGWSSPLGLGEYTDIGCRGHPILRVMGSVTGEEDIIRVNPEVPYDDDDEDNANPGSIVFSASWVDLRTRFPASSQGNRYLAWQGVERMVWGTNVWSVASEGVPFPRLRRWLRGERGLEERETGVKLLEESKGIPKGEVVVRTPKRWRYPSIYEVNGTVFKEDGDRSGVFRSGDGRVLNLKTMIGS